MYRHVMKWVLVASLATVLAACGGATTAQPVVSNATAQAVSTTVAATPAATAVAASTAVSDTAAATAQPSGDLRIFAIVPAQTTASYAVQEQFLKQDLPITAVGTTSAVEGTFQFSADGVPTGQVTKITVDLSTLTSDESKRDQRIHTQWLESDTYPLATFVSTGVEGVPASYTEGQAVTFKLTGNMTIRDVTKPVTFDVTGTLAGDTVTGTATTQIMMADFGFDAPSVAGILTVKDGVTVTVNFTATEAA